MNTRGLRDDVDMKKKVKEIEIGALGSNLTENFKTLKVSCKLVADESTGKRKLTIKVLSVRQEETTSWTSEGGEIKDVRTLRVVRTFVSERLYIYILTLIDTFNFR
ncbi:hypothetical protein ACLB2K_012646 [Fragaria x ananassa]